jgi:hypothetical protein
MQRGLNLAELGSCGIEDVVDGTAVGLVKQLADLGKAEPKTLGAADEHQPLHAVLSIAAPAYPGRADQ